MKTFTDEEMSRLLGTTKPYSVVILKQGPCFGDDTTPGTVWEHGRRNFGLRDDGVLAVVLPVTDGSDVCGIAVFAATVDDAAAIMADDPGVASGVFNLRGAPLPRIPGRRAAVGTVSARRAAHSTPDVRLAAHSAKAGG